MRSITNPEGAVGYFFEDLDVGMSDAVSHAVTDEDIVKFAEVTGDVNPVHLNEDYAKTTMFKGRIAHGIFGAGMISAVFGTKMPGPGCIYVHQNLKFRAPVMLGDTITATVTVTSKDEERGFVYFDTVCTVNGKPVIKGDAALMVPKKA